MISSGLILTPSRNKKAKGARTEVAHCGLFATNPLRDRPQCRDRTGGAFVGEFNVFPASIFGVLGTRNEAGFEQPLDSAQGGGDRAFGGEAEAGNGHSAPRKSGAQQLGEHAPGGVGLEDARQGARSALINVLH